MISIQFSRQVTVAMVGVYLDYNLIKSCASKRSSVRVGMTWHNLVEVSDPIGWVCVRLNALPDIDDGLIWKEYNGAEEELDTGPDNRNGIFPADTITSTRSTTNAPKNTNQHPPNARTNQQTKLAPRTAKERKK